MSDWDRSELHRHIEQSQVDLGRMRDTDVFRTQHVVAGDSVDDVQYIYAHLREALTDLGGHEIVLHRCYLHHFAGSDGNDGRYVIVLDRSVDEPSAADGKPLDAEAVAAAVSDVGKPTEVSTPVVPAGWARCLGSCPTGLPVVSSVEATIPLIEIFVC
jgi:hypothetical protein